LTHPLRLGGSSVTRSGRRVTWSVAEGGRGRRWREAVEHDGTLERSMLMEVGPTGRPTRLELTTRAGLLTLHPDRAQGELHGNVVTPAGVAHLRFTWSPEHELLILGSPAAAAVSLARLARIIAVGETRAIATVRIDDALEPRSVTMTVERTSSTGWRMRPVDGDEIQPVDMDPRGLVRVDDGGAWPLELD
jgi:hypothetical protein